MFGSMSPTLFASINRMAPGEPQGPLPKIQVKRKFDSRGQSGHYLSRCTPMNSKKLWLQKAFVKGVDTAYTVIIFFISTNILKGGVGYGISTMGTLRGSEYNSVPD